MASGTIKSVVPRSDIVDNLTTNDSTKVLSAAQGYALNSKIANIAPITVVKDLGVVSSGYSEHTINLTNDIPAGRTLKTVIATMHSFGTIDQHPITFVHPSTSLSDKSIGVWVIQNASGNVKVRVTMLFE